MDRTALPARRRARARAALPALVVLAALGACDSDEPPLAREDVRGIDELRPYRPDGPWADVLPGCAIIDDPLAACTLQTLPFIAQATTAPATVDDVLERTLVTHDWMGKRFETLLRAAPDDLVRLFGAVTSISIGSTVRPSNYWIATGAVQLDPADLWLDVDEKRNVATAADFRAPLARTLGFRNLWAERLGDAPIGVVGNLEDRGTRTLDDIELPFASVMYHELAHANDFLPPGEAEGLDRSMRPLQALTGIADRWPSTRLATAAPLEALILQRLARVRFLGDAATASEAAIGPVVAGAAMDDDGAVLFYGYSTVHEDFATLFEAAMMKARHGVDFHIAFTDVPPPDRVEPRCSDLTVGWGVRNRLGNARVNLRAGLAVASLFPENAELLAAVAAALGTEEPMTLGTDWCDNVGGAVAGTEDEPGAPDSGPASVAPRARQASATRLPPVEPMSPAERHAIVDARRVAGVR